MISFKVCVNTNSRLSFHLIKSTAGNATGTKLTTTFLLDGTSSRCGSASAAVRLAPKDLVSVQSHLDHNATAVHNHNFLIDSDTSWNQFSGILVRAV